MDAQDPATDPRPDELRAAPRISLVIRTAKLICRSGEYPCVVRDVSATGVRVRLFDALPPDSHLALELANGERYAMERMWCGKDDAGFRFAASIDVEDFIDEPDRHPRRPLRINLKQPAQVTAGGRDINALVVNLSQQGACIETGTPIPLGQQVRLEIGTLPLRFGHVRWRRGFAHGLVFQQGFRLDDFARHCHALQPYDAAAQPDFHQAALGVYPLGLRC